MKKNIINTVTAKALAGQIISSINSSISTKRKKLESEIKNQPAYKKMLALRKKANAIGQEADTLEKEIEKKYSVDIWSGGTINIDGRNLKTKIGRDDLADEIIVLYNVKGKSSEVIIKELTQKYS